MLGATSRWCAERQVGIGGTCSTRRPEVSARSAATICAEILLHAALLGAKTVYLPSSSSAFRVGKTVGRAAKVAV